MENWRAKAFDSFPSLSEELDDAEYSLYLLFFDLGPMVREAHRAHDNDLQSRIYGFAHWCLSADDQELWNAAGVAFYEHLFDELDHWDEITEQLTLDVIEQCWSLWNNRLSLSKLRRLRKLCQRQFPQFNPHIDVVAASGVWTMAYRLLPIRAFGALARILNTSEANKKTGDRDG